MATEHQPREHPVPCSACGYDMGRGYPKARRMTMNLSALCDEHEVEAAQQEIRIMAQEHLDRRRT